MAKPWIGQKVTLKCLSDGFPTPNVTWTKPDRREIKKVLAKENTVTVVMNSDEDFGIYTCKAENGLGAATSTIQVQQISTYVVQ